MWTALYLVLSRGLHGWQAEADDEPLSISEVAISPEAEQSVRDAWEARRREMTVASGGSARGLYATADEYLTLVRQASAGSGGGTGWDGDEGGARVGKVLDAGLVGV